MAFVPFRKDSQLSLRDVQDEMNNLFQKLWHAGLSTGPFDGQDWAPVVDVFEEDDRFMVRAEIPGLNAAGVELTYADGVLTVKGHKDQDFSDEQRKSLIQHERRFGTFSRCVSLPVTVDPSKMSATCHNGLLEVTLLKTEESRPKGIKIEVTE